MPMMPAICDSCGTAFASGIYLDNCLNVTLQGNRTGPCPACGSMGSVPDGVFNALGDFIEVLDAPLRTYEQLKRLSEIFDSAAKNKSSNTEISEKIKKECPELASLADVLPKNRMELYTCIGAITGFLMLLASLMQDSDEITSKDIDASLNQAIEQLITPKTPFDQSALVAPQRNVIKQPRNERCSCGSGVKFKKCCGLLV